MEQGPGTPRIITLTSDYGVDSLYAAALRGAIISRDPEVRIVDVSHKGESVRVNGLRKKDAVLNDNDLVMVRSLKMHFHRGLPVGR